MCLLLQENLKLKSGRQVSFLSLEISRNKSISRQKYLNSPRSSKNKHSLSFEVRKTSIFEYFED